MKNSNQLVEAFDVDRIYLRHKNQGLAPDYRVSNVACKMQESLYRPGVAQRVPGGLDPQIS